MATYLELRTIFTDSDLMEKLEVAVIIAAQTILAGDDDTDPPWDQTAGAHDIRVKWAAAAIKSTSTVATAMLKAVLAANNTLTVAQIQGASDAAIQSNVEAVIDSIANAEFGA